MRTVPKKKKMEERFSQFERKDDQVIVERHLITSGTPREVSESSLLAALGITSSGKLLI